MSTDHAIGVKGVYSGREIVDVDECDQWRDRVHGGETASQVARDVDGWAYDTVHSHIKDESCAAHAPNTVSPAKTGGRGGGLPVATGSDVEGIRAGLRDALDANFGDTANIRIKSFRKNRAVDVRGQIVGVVMDELAEEGDPHGEFVVEDGNPDSGTSWWMVRYADGGAR